MCMPPSFTLFVEAGDLGAFNNVFNALTLLNSSTQPQLRSFPAPTPSSSVETNTSPSLPALSESEAEEPDAHAVRWNTRPDTTYAVALLPSLPSTPPPGPILDEEEDEATTEGHPNDEDDALPSLGYLDSTLGFIAEERARLAAQLQASGLGTDAVIPHARRKRRRRRKTPRRDGDEGSPEYDTSTGDAISAPEPNSRRSIPPTPRSRRGLPKQSEPPPPQPASVGSRTYLEPSPAVQRLRGLAHKLRALYPDDAAHLARVLQDMREPSELGNAIDVRGLPATAVDPVVHVFVDYSNILIGFLTYIKRHPELHHRRTRDDKPLLSHEALMLILERGRPTARRELAASKPLYQSMTTAYQLGFEVHLFQRVQEEADASASPRQNQQSALSSDSDPVMSPATGRSRWREQGVDECLQLKMYQSVVGPDTPGTLVLATGDAAPSQFNAAGFPGSVRSALERGWKVELCAWESGLGGGWTRLFGDHPRFSVRGLEMFAEDLLAIDPPLST